nr:hypothetical protein [Pseudomonadota bacterium]
MNLNSKQGFALVATMIMLSVLLALLGAYTLITKIELATTKYHKSSNVGFNASEGGLNLRAEEIRQVFTGYNTPSGSSPSSTSPCTGSNNGSGT